MALDEKDLLTINSVIQKALGSFGTSLNTALDAKITGYIAPVLEQVKQVPGMAARIAKENAEELFKTFKQPEPVEKHKDTVASVKAEFDAKWNAVETERKNEKAAIARKELEVDIKSRPRRSWDHLVRTRSRRRRFRQVHLQSLVAWGEL